MDITQMINTGPAKALGLFDKLAATSDGAADTRGQLMDELTVEIQRYAQLEEKYLIPVLNKHEYSRDLAQDAASENRRTLTMLEEMERTPKDAPEFLTSLTELRQLFQQHVSSERKQLAAIRKSLSDKDLRDLTEGIKGGYAEAEQARQDEAEQRSVAAREQREADQRQAEHRHQLREAAKQRRAAAANQQDEQRKQADQAQRAALRETATATEHALQQMAQGLPRGYQVPSTAQTYNEVWMELFAATTGSAVRATAALGDLSSPHLAAQAQMRWAIEMGRAWQKAGTQIVEITLRGPFS